MTDLEWHRLVKAGEDAGWKLVWERVIAPEAKSQSITFKEGTLEAVLTGGVLTSLRVSCAGSIRVVLADTPVSLSATAAFTERDVEIPQEVVDALVK